MPQKISIVVCVVLLMTACQRSPSSPTEAPTTESLQTGTPISACQRIIRPGQYYLNEDIDGAPVALSIEPQLHPAYTGERSLEATCIEITASNVNLDCQGYTLTGASQESAATVGIYIAGNPESTLTDITVVDCAISQHQFGLYAAHLSDSVISGNQVRRNRGTGLYLIGLSSVAVDGNIAEGNDPDGILLINSQNVTIANSLALYNRMRGITFEGCQNCTVTGNESHSHGVLGFAIYGSNDMILEENTAYNNRYHGFAILHEAGSATFRSNASYQNEGSGFFLQGSSGNYYTANVSRGNGLDGISILNDPEIPTENNTFEGNTVQDNSGYAVFSNLSIEEEAFSSNTFSGNGQGEMATGNTEDIDWCSYTGFGTQGPCDPVFEGGPNPKDPEATTTGIGPTPTAPVSTARVIHNARVEANPIYYPAMGDLWMTTWADDDRLYVTWGDGSGYREGYPVGYPAYQNSEPIQTTLCAEKEVYTLEDEGYFPCWLWCNVFPCGAEYSYPPAPLTDAGVLALTGPVPTFTDVSITSIDVPDGRPFILQEQAGHPMDINGRNDKPSSLLFVDGRLYYAGHSPAGQPRIGYIAYSDDYGQTWTEVPNSPWGNTSNFRVLMFINMGQSYSLSQDSYVYALGIGTESAIWTEWTNRSVYLTRVPRDTIIDYRAYEYFAGLDAGAPRWSTNEADAAPLDTLSTVGQGSAMYHEGTGRYLFMTSSTDYLPDSGAYFGHGGLFEAPEPWGPWTQVAELCFQPECDDGSYNPLWTDRDAPVGTEPGKYIPGLISKDAGSNYVYFTIAGGNTHYQLQIGRLEWATASSAAP